MRAWLGVVSRSHVQRGKAGGFIQLCHGKAAPLRTMAEGDHLIYYSPRTDLKQGEPLQAFTAYCILGPQEIHQVAMSPDFHPFRRAARYLEAHEAPIRPLLPSLSFTREGGNWGMLLRRGHLHLTLADLALISAAMGVQPA